MINKTQDDEKKIVDEIKENIKPESIRAIYLYGSVAKGKASQKSDYDIAIIVKRHNPRNDLKIITNIKYALIDKIKRPLDIVILDIKDLYHSPVFLNEIYDNNIKLYGRSDVLKRSKPILDRKKPIIVDHE